MPTEWTEPNYQRCENIKNLLDHVPYSCRKEFPKHEESPSYLETYHFQQCSPWRQGQDMLERLWKSNLYFGNTYPNYNSQGRHLYVLLQNRPGIHLAYTAGVKNRKAGPKFIAYHPCWHTQSTLDKHNSGTARNPSQFVFSQR